MRVTAPMAVSTNPQTSLWSNHCMTSTDDAPAGVLRPLLRVDVGLLFFRVMACQIVSMRARQPAAGRYGRKRRPHLLVAPGWVQRQGRHAIIP